MDIATNTIQYHEMIEGSFRRRIAYEEHGNLFSSHIFLLLPGLLESRLSFKLLCQHLSGSFDCRIITFDYCGRGASDALKRAEDYKMSTYLLDTEDLLRSYILKSHRNPAHTLYLVGSSMGGILAMHLIKKMGPTIHGLILNDIGLVLNWLSLFQLYKKINIPFASKNNASIATSLNVHESVLERVKSPTHFDIEYEYDFMGMHFTSLLEAYTGSVSLIHHTQSVLCPLFVANKSKKIFPSLNLLSYPGADHPVAWTLDICKDVSRELSLRVKPKIRPLLLSYEMQQSKNLSLQDIKKNRWVKETVSGAFHPTPTKDLNTLKQFIDTSKNYLKTEIASHPKPRDDQLSILCWLKGLFKKKPNKPEKGL